MKVRLSAQTLAIWIVLVALIAVFGLLSSLFLRPTNLFDIGKQVAVEAIIAVGMTCVILTGGIDLSVGSLLALTGVVTSILIVKSGWNPAVAVVAGLLVGTVSGAVVGLLYVLVDIPPLISTLGMMTILRGLSYIISNGLPIYGLPRGIAQLGQGNVWVVPISVVFMAATYLIGALFLLRTYPGRYIYALGGNAEATRLAGINVKGLKILVYIISGLLASFAGIILLGRLNSGQPTVGEDTALDVITAVLLGGVSIFGGEGRLTGVLAGSIIIGVLSNGLIVLNVNEFYQMVVKGVVLIIAVGVDTKSRSLRGKPQPRKA